jgi:hypothetical protein
MTDECSGSVGAYTCTHATQRRGCSTRRTPSSTPSFICSRNSLAVAGKNHATAHLIVRVSGSSPSNSRCSPQPLVQMCTAKTRPCASTLKSGQG